ncbi:PAS domain-containing sensor histidine kinase [Methylobacterium sp. WSM2598]|uniref:PAS domain-containing sensor histidine kinase n=1 Tax=Methylobacterium sp. WSM2598 TaxID=398261 RepID=UPI00039A845B|nr:PAS domain-containing sensor histidine kinase [Methylobacterium sp. WSM2598]
MDEGALFEAKIAALTALPALARLTAGRPIACLFLDESAERVLHHSPAAKGLRDAIADPQGRIDRDLDVPRQLRGLRHLAPDGEKPRLSRLRIDPGGLAPPLVCACLVVSLPGDRRALALIPTDPLPALRPRRRHAVPAPAPPSPPVSGTGAAPMRFLWRSDAEGRIVEATEALTGLVGRTPLGRSWAELLADTVQGTSDDLAAALAARRTFRALPVLWRFDGTERGVAVDLSGAPRLGEGRAFAGFSGFGVIRPDRVAPMPPARAAAPAKPSLRERAAAVIAIGRASAPEEPGRAATWEPPPVPELPAFASLAGATLAGFAGMMAATPLNAFGLGWPFCLDEEGSAEPPTRKDAEPVAAAAAPRASAEPVAQAAPEPVARAAPEPPLAPPEPDAAPAPGPETRPEPAAGDGEAGRRPEAAGRDETPAPAAEPAPEVPRPLAPGQLSLNEHAAFREIARILGARFAGDAPQDGPSPARDAEEAPRRAGAVTPFPALALARAPERGPSTAGEVARVLDRLPIGILVHRGEEVLLANRALLCLADYESAEALTAAGGAGSLFRGRDPASLAVGEGDPAGGAGHPVVLATRTGEALPVAAVLTPVEWGGAPASLLALRRLPEEDPARHLRAAELERARQEARLRESEAVLDAVTDGVVTLDERGRVLALNKGAAALFGHEPREVSGEDLTVLFAQDGRPAIRAALERARAGEPASTEVAAEGGEPILALTLAPLAQEEPRRFSVLLRDVSAARRTEAELLRAKRAAEAASSQKSDFLATISHEIRTPLNAILGFTEVMMEEQFGPIGNERYRDYLRDIRSSGEHVVSLVTDLLDLAKIEAGHLDLHFTGVVLNDLVGASVSLMQPQAARQRVVVRTSFANGLRPVLGDQRSLRQAALNLIANAIKFTDAGGQVIVSTAMTDRGGVALRVRDTGIGMTPDEVETALQPFRQVATAQNRRGRGTGLGLPLTKALVEANRGTLRVSSRKHEGTLVEVLFPPARVLAI